MRLFCLFLIVNIVDAQFSFYDLSRVNKDCRKTQFEKIFALENPYEFGDPFRRAAKLCKSVTKYVSLYNRDNEKLSQLVNLNLGQKPYTADELAATVTKVLEQNQN